MTTFIEWLDEDGCVWQVGQDANDNLFALMRDDHGVYLDVLDSTVCGSDRVFVAKIVEMLQASKPVETHDPHARAERILMKLIEQRGSTLEIEGVNLASLAKAMAKKMEGS